MRTSGEKEYNNGEYKGNLVFGQRCGNGDMDFSDGSTYSGQWNSDRFNGKGKLQLEEGTIIEGWWEDGDMTAGTITYPNGSEYSGQWKRSNCSNFNRLIMDMALRGDCDCLGEIDIYWKKADNYMFVLVIKYDGKCWYRLFLCQDGTDYERKQIMYSLDHNDDPALIYGFYSYLDGAEESLQKAAPDDILAKIETVADCYFEADA